MAYSRDDLLFLGRMNVRYHESMELHYERFINWTSFTSVLLSSAAFVSFSSLLPESLQSSKEAIFSVVALVVTTLNAAVLALGMFNKFTTHSELKKQWIIFLAHLDRADESHLGDIEQELHDLNAREPAASPKLLHKAHEKTKAALGWVNPSCAHQ